MRTEELLERILHEQKKHRTAETVIASMKQNHKPTRTTKPNNRTELSPATRRHHYVWLEVPTYADHRKVNVTRESKIVVVADDVAAASQSYPSSPSPPR